MSFRYLCKVSLMRAANRRIYVSQALIPRWTSAFLSPFGEHIPAVFFWLRSCIYRHVLCRLGMWTARLSTLCVYRHIHFSETTPKRIHYLSEVLKRSLWLPARSQSWLTSFCVGFFFFSLSESFPLSVFWRGPARLHGWSTSYVLGSTACLGMVWENSCSPLPEMESSMNAAVAHRGCFHLYQNVKAELSYSIIHWHCSVILCLLCFL